MQDEILEEILTKLSKTIDPATAVKLHKKANKRLSELKANYDSMIGVLTAQHENEDETEIKSLEQITLDLNSVAEKDLTDQIQIYCEARKHFAKQKQEFTSVENELAKVSKHRSKLQIEPINLEELIN
jgi:hypothetical protein